MSRIFWDTSLFIYLLESQGSLFIATKKLLLSMEKREDTLLTSTLTVGEVLVKAASPSMCEDYFQSQGVEIITFDMAASRQYARIRQIRTIRAPDAIQLACAAAGKTDLFVTNDARLSRVNVPGIGFIVPLDRAPL